MDALIYPDKKHMKPQVPMFVSIIETHVVLEHLFNYLDLRTIKTARLVCRSWSDAGIQRLRNGELVSLQLEPCGIQLLRLLPCGTMNLISIKLPLTPQDVDGIQSFICNGRIPHSLRLSLQMFPWYFRTNRYIYGTNVEENYKAGEMYTYERHKDRGELILKQLLNTGIWVTELRLETTMVDEDDAMLLTQIFVSIPHVTKCYLDLVLFEDLGFFSLPMNLFPLSLTTLGIQLHKNFMAWNSEVLMHREDSEPLSLSAVTHFMNAVSSSNIQFLDFQKCNQVFHRSSSHMNSLVKGMHSIMTNASNSFSKLIGIQRPLNTEYDLEVEELKLWNTFPKSLSHLDLFINQFHEFLESIGKLEKVSSILQRHISTLRSLNLFWYDGKAVEFHTKLELPRLPLLTTLDFTSMARTTWDGWTLDMLDLLKLRDIFLEGPQALRWRFPFLKTMSVFMFYETGTEIWEHIFPANLEFVQIETLNVSLVVDADGLKDECISPLLTHFQTIFPSLRKLRHIKRIQKEDDDKEHVDVACKHTIQNGLVIARTTTFNSWNNFGSEFRHYGYDLPMHYLLRSMSLIRICFLVELKPVLLKINIKISHFYSQT